MKILLISGMLTVSLLPPMAPQENGPWVELPESATGPVVVDGIFDPIEWRDAQEVFDGSPCSVLLKRFGGHLFVGVGCPSSHLPLVDLFLHSPGGEIQQLHASSYLDARVLPQDDSVEPFWDVSTDIDWTANKVTWSSEVRDSLVSERVLGPEMLREAILPMDGFEFKIREDSMEGSTLSLRIEATSMSPDEGPFVFPAGSTRQTPRGWLLVHLVG